MPSQSFVYRTTKRFRRSLEALTPEQRAMAKAAFRLFRRDPWDPQLGRHIIKELTAAKKQPVWSVWVDDDLRVIFVVDESIITSLDIGKHAIYKAK